MGFRFHRSVRVCPGVRLNLSKSGGSVSFGGPGARLNVGPRGVCTTVGLPGSGLSYVTQSLWGGRNGAGGGYVLPSGPSPYWSTRRLFWTVVLASVLCGVAAGPILAYWVFP